MKLKKHRQITPLRATTLTTALTAIAICAPQCACATSSLDRPGEETPSGHAVLREPSSLGDETHTSNHSSNEILKFIPQGSDIRLSRTGDIDNDGDEDALVVLQKPGDEHRFEPRTLLVLQRNAYGQLIKRTESPKGRLMHILRRNVWGSSAEHRDVNKRFFAPIRRWLTIHVVD